MTNPRPHYAQRNAGSRLPRPAIAVALLAVAFFVATPRAGAQTASYGLATTDTAPATLPDGQQAGLLRITATNFGTAGTADAELVKLGLRLEVAPGTPLTPDQASVTLASLAVHADTNFSGTFEPALDAQVAVVLVPAPAGDGTFAMDLTQSEPAAVRVPAGQSRTYFIVGALAHGASVRTPHTLRVTHVTNGPSKSAARDAGTGLPLTLQTVADAPSTLVTAVGNTGPTTTGIPDVVALAPSLPGSVSLFTAFQDAQDTPAELTYAVTGNTNPALFSFVGIDPGKGTLALNYLPGVNGTSLLTVRATDRSGQSVATTFKVSVGLLQTYADWAAFYSAGTSLQQDAIGTSNLTKYAFALDPTKGGDIAGLPRLQRTGNSRVFTHLRPRHSTDLAYRYEISTDLATWQTATHGVHYFQSVADLADGRSRVDLLVLASSPKVFLRARADLSTAGLTGQWITGSGSGDPGDPSGPPAPPTNLLPPGGAHPIHGTTIFPQVNVVNSASQRANDVASGDLDGDGLLDLLSASFASGTGAGAPLTGAHVSWYRNLGDGTFSSEHVLAQLAGASVVKAVDFNGDGLTDVYAGAPGNLVWFRNLGGGNFSPAITIATDIDYALYVTSIDSADLDGDGRQDALFTTVSYTEIYNPAYDRVGWFRNGAVAGDPQQVAFTMKPLITTNARGPRQAVVGDIDGDSIMDVVSCSGTNISTKIAWYRGLGGGNFGPQQMISSALRNPTSICVSDLDLDGRLDVVSVATDDYFPEYYNRVTWHRNLGVTGFVDQPPIGTNARGALSVAAMDLNGDRLPEVVVGSYTIAGVFWYDNHGDSFSTEQVIVPASAAGGAKSVALADWNGDGTGDVAFTSFNTNKVSWIPDTGGQFALATADTAPAGIVEGVRDDVLRVSVTNRGWAGNDSARLRTLALLFESAPGVPLDTTAANNLIDALYLYADTNNSGAFEPAADKPIYTAYHLPLTAGRITLSLAASNAPEWQVPPGATRQFFVVCAMTANAAAQAIHSYRVTHLASDPAPTTGADAQTGALLTLEQPVANVTASTVTAQVNQAPVSSGIPAVFIFDTIATTSIPLWQYFGDAEDADSQLSFATTGNTNASLLAFTGINPATGELLLKYRPGVGGNTQITVRATDTGGKSVTASFTVSVQVVASLNEWLSLYHPGGAPGALADNVRSYAFALDPRVPGDQRGLPRIQRQGQTRVLTHLRPKYAADLAYTYEISTNLTTWTTAVNGVDYYQFVTDLPDSLRQIDLVILAPGPKAFLRARSQVLP